MDYASPTIACIISSLEDDTVAKRCTDSRNTRPRNKTRLITAKDYKSFHGLVANKQRIFHRGATRASRVAIIRRGRERSPVRRRTAMRCGGPARQDRGHNQRWLAERAHAVTGGGMKQAHTRQNDEQIKNIFDGNQLPRQGNRSVTLYQEQFQ